MTQTETIKSRMILRTVSLSVLIFFIWPQIMSNAQNTPTCAISIVTQSGDTLSTLASKYYDDPLAYPRIVAATNALAATNRTYTTIDRPDTISIGWQLCIPGPIQPQAQIFPQFTAEDLFSVLFRSITETDFAELDNFTVPSMRQQEFNGSDMALETTLSPGQNYNRYITSYQSDNLRIYALLTIPFGERPSTGWPVIIVNHGYVPPEIYDSAESYRAYTDYFAQQGYIVFQPDYRGLGDSDAADLSLETAAGYTVDMLNAVSSIKRFPDADPNRIGMWGHSMGGYLALRTMATTNDVKAGVLWAGVTPSSPEMVTQWVGDYLADWVPTGIWGNLIMAQYRALIQNSAIWQAISLNEHLNALSGPIQLHHGTADAIVPANFSADLHNKLQIANHPVEYYPYLGDDHHISQNFLTAMARTVAFFDTYVKSAASAG